MKLGREGELPLSCCSCWRSQGTFKVSKTQGEAAINTGATFNPMGVRCSAQRCSNQKSPGRRLYLKSVGYTYSAYCVFLQHPTCPMERKKWRPPRRIGGLLQQGHHLHVASHTLSPLLRWDKGASLLTTSAWFFRETSEKIWLKILCKL